MLKVIIADDEQKVCKLIEKLIDWQELGFEVVGVGHSGPEVYDLICSNKPDVVITDIRMPGFDGLELIKRTKKLGLSTSFIIISGYRHFEYAHDALKYGVEDYLLKPIDKDELDETLIKIRKQRSEEEVRTEDELRIKNQLADNIDKIRWQFIHNIMLNNDEEKSLNIEDINKEYHLNFRDGLFQAMFIKLDSPLNTETSAEKILKKTTEITKKFFDPKCTELVVYISNSGLTCILNYPCEQRDSIQKQFRDLFKEVKNYIDSFFTFNLTLGIGGTKTSITEVSKSISSAIDAVKCRITLGVDRIIEYNSLDYEENSISPILTTENKTLLSNIIETMDKKKFELWISVVFDELRSKDNYNPCRLFEASVEIRNKTLQIFKEMEIKSEVQRSFKKEFNIILDAAISEKMIMENIKNFVSTQLDFLSQEKRMQDNRPIRLAKQFILEHYMEALSLDEVAESIHMNPSYLSSIFKKDTGINFSDYLINCRLEAAKELLKNSNSSMVEIAEKIGYTDTKYFSKLFNKIVGIKPSEYRKLYS